MAVEPSADIDDVSFPVQTRAAIRSRLAALDRRSVENHRRFRTYDRFNRFEQRGLARVVAADKEVDTSEFIDGQLRERSITLDLNPANQ